MNREIKFRAWDKENGMFPVEAMNWHKDGSIYDNGHILMQYTGLHDKNGKEIYEGDIVHNKSLSMKGEIKIGFHETSLGKHYGWYIHRYMKIGKDKETSWESPHWEIIGNIYENPEFLTLSSKT